MNSKRNVKSVRGTNYKSWRYPLELRDASNPAGFLPISAMEIIYYTLFKRKNTVVIIIIVMIKRKTRGGLKIRQSVYIVNINIENYSLSYKPAEQSFCVATNFFLYFRMQSCVILHRNTVVPCISFAPCDNVLREFACTQLSFYHCLINFKYSE